VIELDHTPRILEVGRESFAETAAGLLADAIDSTPSLVLGVATGDTPEPVYAALADCRADGLRTEGVTLVALDEYVGLPSGSPHGYAHYVRARIAEPLGVLPENCYVPDGSASDVDLAADEFERAVAELGGVDLQIVGIGENGHLGFNEPGSSATSRTRVVELTTATRRANSRFFDGDLAAVPTHAITQGIATILSASRILLLVRGASKAAALHAALRGPVDPSVPASWLQRHPSVTVVADTEALHGG
jgi:glucosamine-6-phosphate deaminase